MGCGSSTEGKQPLGVERDTGGQYMKVPDKKPIGSGASCQVWVAHKTGDDSTSYAMKVLTKTPRIGELWRQEVDLLSALNQTHDPNVVQMVDSFQGSKHYYIITHLCEGGELFDRVVDQNVKFTEALVARITVMMLKSLKHCHSNGIVHRDIKPENFLFDTPDLDSNMKLIDFGCALKTKDDENISTWCGSLYYIAPEVLAPPPRTGAMWKKSDVWSVGVILYMLLTGFPPFPDNEHISENIREKPYRSFRGPEKKLSDQVKDLVAKLLCKDWTKRPSVEEALAHPWLKGEAEEVEIDHAAIEHLAQFKERCHLQKAVAKVLGGRVAEEDHQRVKNLFEKFDTNKDGRLDKTELVALMNFIGKGDEVEEMLEHADEDGDGHLDLVEFKTMHAAKDIGKKSDQELKALFHEFDKSGDGLICADEIRMFCNVNDKKAEKILKDVDTSNDGMIDCDEWIEALRKGLLTS